MERIRRMAMFFLPKSIYRYLNNRYYHILAKLGIRYFGMTNRKEQRYLQYYATEVYSGLGEIVDLGCWLGSTTIPLARGLSRNKGVVKEKRKIFAYDLFIWETWMGEEVCGHDKKPGDSFLPEFKELTNHWKSVIEVCEGDLETIEWNGKSIEFLVIDAMKSWNLMNSIVHHFFPYLVPGVSYLVYQDFKHYYTPWIHLLNHRLRNSFELVCNIPSSGSIVLKYTKPMNKEWMNAAYSFESFSTQEIDDAFQHSFDMVPENEHVNIAAAKVMLYIQRNNMERAKREIQQFFDQGIPRVSDMEIVAKLLGM